jgi:probable phosphoglycerate mutase
MIRLALLRHGPTAWNADKRLQGRSDQPLSPDGEAALAAARVPDAYRRFRWLTSPLRRARRTADLLDLDAAIEPAAVEMDFGDWEGRRLSDVRAADPHGVRANEDRGLDFTPPGGESPRMVQARLAPLLRRLAAERRDTGVVTHKGVIRALIAQATGWPMLGTPPVKPNWRALHLFSVDADGLPRLIEANIQLDERP